MNIEDLLRLPSPSSPPFGRNSETHIPSRNSAFEPYHKVEESWFLHTVPPSTSPLSCDRNRSGNSAKERRPRTTFSTDQCAKLEEEYSRHEYISRSKRLKLAQMLRLNEGQIKIWFQNRRAKDKRIEKAHMDSRLRYLAALSLSPLLPAQPPFSSAPPSDRKNDHSSTITTSSSIQNKNIAHISTLDNS